MADVEVKMEVEAVEAVYGGDCVVLDSYPPRLHLRIKPRTADISSQQFVEAVIGIRAGEQYPEEPPSIQLIDSKGLDERRQNRLITSMQNKALEASSCLMLVALCEEAVEQLSLMNHPDGDCPLCLYPLVADDGQCETSPFMKLMSCFHCFHSECIIRWWNWLQTEEENSKYLSSLGARPPINARNQVEVKKTDERSMAKCPVCRMVFHTRDLEHVLDLVGAHSSHSSVEGSEGHDDDVLWSESENKRRQRFEEIETLQQGKSGLIEPKRDIVVLPGMYLPSPVTTPSSASAKATEKPQPDAAVTTSGGSSHHPGTSRPQNTGMRKHRGQNSRKQVGQWIRKDDRIPSDKS